MNSVSHLKAPLFALLFAAVLLTAPAAAFGQASVVTGKEGETYSVTLPSVDADGELGAPHVDTFEFTAVQNENHVMIVARGNVTNAAGRTTKHEGFFCQVFLIDEEGEEDLVEATSTSIVVGKNGRAVMRCRYEIPDDEENDGDDDSDIAV